MTLDRELDRRKLGRRCHSRTWRSTTVATLALIALALAAGAAPANASDGTFERMWGWGVDDGTAGFQVCTGGCQAGIEGSGDGQFNWAYGVATDAAGNVYVADHYNRRIQKFDSDGTFITKWGSQGSGDGQFNTPTGIATDAAGNVYVADSNNRIQKFDSNGTFITKWGTSGSGDGQFDYPFGVATDAAGDVYVADFSNNRIQKFDSDGTFITKWGTSGSGDGQFDDPAGIATDAAGNVYVADSSNRRIQKFDSDGNFITKWGSFGSGDGQFNLPYGITTDAAGDVYVADSLNYRIQKFDSNGTFITKWGTSGSGDGQFNYPLSIATDAAGDVYVADYLNERIQKFGTAPNQAPTADAGPDQTVASEANVDLDGTGSSDPDPGDDLTYSWVQSGGQSVTLTGADTATPSFVAPTGPAALSFELEVCDDEPLCDTDSVDVNVNDPAPETTIDAGPTGPTNDPTPTFAFSADEPGSSFECKIDNESFAPCSSPHTTDSLGEGDHTFAVRAIDNANNPDPTPATRTFKVDTVAPVASLSCPPAPAPSNSSPVSCSITASDPGGADASGVPNTPGWMAYIRDTNPGPGTSFNGHFYTGPFDIAGDGIWDVEAIVVDRALNVSAFAPLQVRIDTTAPETTIDAGPNDPTNDPTPTFAFSADEPGSSFECRIDNESFAPCSSPHTTDSLGEGDHSFAVRAIDNANNTDPTPATRTFKVDTVAPVASLSCPPAPAPSNSSPVSCSITASDPGGADASGIPNGWVVYGLDTDPGPATTYGGHFYTGPFDVAGDGRWEVLALTVDRAYNVSALVTVEVEIDTTGP